jgi:lactate dehydrogenase-like 2-hydroxyacid dehydrogenase
MPGTALSVANIPGMSSDSFAALAVGALLAGASALKIAGRRVRDRKAGIGVVTI